MEQEKGIYSEILENLKYELKFRLAEFDLLCDNAESKDVLNQLIIEREFLKSKIERDISEIRERIEA